MKKMFVVVLALLMSTTVWAGDVITVKGRGMGMNEAAALSDAYRDAVETAVGLFVDAEQMVKNDALIKDEILTQSNGYVVGYDMLSKKARDGLVEVKILAKVKKQEIIKSSSCMMEAKDYAVGSELQEAHAQSESTALRGAAGAALIEKRLAGMSLEKMLCDCTLASPECVIEKSGTSRGENVRVAYAIKRSVSEERYFNEVMPKIRQILAQVSLAEPEDATISVKRKQWCDWYQVKDIESFVALQKDKAFSSSCKLQESVEMESTAFEMFSKFNGGVWLRDDTEGVAARVVLVTGVNKLRTIYKVEIYSLDIFCAKAVSQWLNTAQDERMSTKPSFVIKFMDEDGEPLVERPIKFSYPGQCLATNVASCQNAVTYTIGPFFFRPGINNSTSWGCDWMPFEIARDAMPLVRSIRIEAVK